MATDDDARDAPTGETRPSPPDDHGEDDQTHDVSANRAPKTVRASNLARA